MSTEQQARELLDKLNTVPYPLAADALEVIKVALYRAYSRGFDMGGAIAQDIQQTAQSETT